MSLNSIVSRAPRIETIPSTFQVTDYQLLEIYGRKYLIADFRDGPIVIHSDRDHVTSPQCLPTPKYNSNKTYKLQM